MKHIAVTEMWLSHLFDNNIVINLIVQLIVELQARQTGRPGESS